MVCSPRSLPSPARTVHSITGASSPTAQSRTSNTSALLHGQGQIRARAGILLAAPAAQQTLRAAVPARAPWAAPVPADDAAARCQQRPAAVHLAEAQQPVHARSRRSSAVTMQSMLRGPASVTGRQPDTACRRGRKASAHQPAAVAGRAIGDGLIEQAIHRGLGLRQGGIGDGGMRDGQRTAAGRARERGRAGATGHEGTGPWKRARSVGGRAPYCGHGH